MRKNRLASILAAVAVSVVVIVSAGLSQNRGETRAAFEVVSIRPSGPAPVGTRGAGPGGGVPGGRGAGAQVVCPYRGTVIDPAHMTAPRITTFRLITWAFEPKGCVLEMGLITGQPEWTKTDLYDFQATMPSGTPVYAFQQLQDGEAPKLQEMLQTMLEDRFKLKFHREKREVAAYELVVEKPGKMTPSKDQTPPTDPFGAGAGTRGALTGLGFGADGAPQPGLMLMDGRFWQGTSITVSGLAGGFGARAGRPVIDKTGLTGFFDIKVPITPDPNATPGRGLGGTGSGAGLSTIDAQMLDGLGLKLESSKTIVDVLVIDHIEKPTEN
jgi:uncharacterized protein (TIGR03435 family)